ncbi:alkaline phosphatase-like [Agrilus planipennis]|uniref:alkaline phosphatase n=1 Tax=Agrilus planipennis TaxID=224129 RepID=A0A1W4X4E9_AGRPL|nr:alkaline phosphatase-like [Agrilus planipennis]
MDLAALMFILFTCEYTLCHTINHEKGNFRNSATEKSVHNPHHVGTRDFEVSNSELEPEYWIRNAQLSILNKVDKLNNLNTGRAKNIIMFLGDGMSIPTVTAARIYKGQKHGLTGEEQQLSFEKFPYVGLSKTYSVDYQTTDSAATATAYLTGVKTNYGTIGVTASVNRKNCTAMLNKKFHTTSIAEWAQNAGKRTGFVTTTRVTHASPSPLFAHSADRDWESDTDVSSDGQDPTICRDLAYQLIHNKAGQKLNVIMGGGRGKFFPSTTYDEYGNIGERSDGENLIEKWKNYKKHSPNSKYAYVHDRAGLLHLSNEDYVLGLFAQSHVSYELDRDPEVVPSIAEMTQKAIKLLSKGKNGFFLFVEGGRIDHAHHDVLAKKSLEETVAFAQAIEVAVDMTNDDDTLIVVTSDHSHTLSISGYTYRGNDILGEADIADDGLPYLSLGYANGKNTGRDSTGVRHNVSEDEDLGTKDYEYPGMVLLDSETHGGDDVGIFARGPWAHLLTGVNEQNVIPHVMAYASCIGNGRTVCSLNKSSLSSSSVTNQFFILAILLPLVLPVYNTI